MTTYTEIEQPRLAAFGAPIWAYKPVSILGYEIAAALLIAVMGVLLIAVPIVVAFVVGGDLSTAHATYSSEVAPSSYVVPNPGPPTLIDAHTGR